jgi:hypothetical protein
LRLFDASKEIERLSAATPLAGRRKGPRQKAMPGKGRGETKRVFFFADKGGKLEAKERTFVCLSPK